MNIPFLCLETLLKILESEIKESLKDLADVSKGILGDYIFPSSQSLLIQRMDNDLNWAAHFSEGLPLDEKIGSI